MSRLVRIALLSSIALGLARPFLAATAGSEASPPAGMNGITTADLKAHVVELAADSYEGRDTLSDGERKAREYIASRFQSYGLAPLSGATSHALELTLYETGYDRGETRVELELGGTAHPLEAGVDFAPFPFSTRDRIEGDVVFAGYGITAPAAGHDDYRDLDAKGKIVLVLRHSPHEKDAAHPLTGSEHALFMTKAQNAKAHGAVAMMLVTDPLHHSEAEDLRLPNFLTLDPIRDASGPMGGENGALVSVQISRAAAERIAAQSRHPLRELQAAVDRGEPASGVSLRGARARIAVVSQDTSRPVTAYNVAAVLPGSDPQLAREWVVVGAHYDHVGAFAGGGGADAIYHGADDNASGVAGLLELAQAFASLPRAPRRSLAFVAFTGEEKGLLGSYAFVRQARVPIADTVFMLNLDMIGRNPERPVDVVGDAFASGVGEIVTKANAEIALPIRLGGTEYAANSDHHPFYEKHVPFLFLFTGLHPDYHQPGDHADKIAFERMEPIVRLAFRVLEGVTGADSAPRFVHPVAWLGAAIEIGRGPAAREARITHVASGSLAARAGLRAGDLLRAIDDDPLEGGADAVARLEALPHAVSKRISVVRNGEAEPPLALIRPAPGFLGVEPGPPEADARRSFGLAAGDGILVRRLVAGGPAATAGLAVGDVILELGGEPIGLGNLAARLAQLGAGTAVDLTVGRAAERKSLTVTLGTRPNR